MYGRSRSATAVTVSLKLAVAGRHLRQAAVEAKESKIDINDGHTVCTDRLCHGLQVLSNRNHRGKFSGDGLRWLPGQLQMNLKRSVETFHGPAEFSVPV